MRKSHAEVSGGREGGLCSPYSQNSLQRILYWLCSSSHRQGTRLKTDQGYIVVDLEVSFPDSCSLFNRGTLSSLSLAPQSYISITVHLVSSGKEAWTTETEESYFSKASHCKGILEKAEKGKKRHSRH